MGNDCRQFGLNRELVWNKAMQSASSVLKGRRNIHATWSHCTETKSREDGGKRADGAEALGLQTALLAVEEESVVRQIVPKKGLGRPNVKRETLPKIPRTRETSPS